MSVTGTANSVTVAEHALFFMLTLAKRGRVFDRETRKGCQLDSKATTTLELAMEKLGLSARAYQRILRVARTIADLVAEEQINVTHISEAIGYRRLDRRWRDE